MNLHIRTDLEVRQQAPNFEKYFPIALDFLIEERLRQISLWTDNDFDGKTPADIHLILSEEVGEVAKAIQEGDAKNLHEEICQVAAVAVKWLEHLALQEGRKGEYENSTNDSTSNTVSDTTESVIDGPQPGEEYTYLHAPPCATSYGETP